MVKVARHDQCGMKTHRYGRRLRERPIPISQKHQERKRISLSNRDVSLPVSVAKQDGNRVVIVIGYREIDLAIPIEVRRDNSSRVIAGSIVDVTPESAVAIADKNGNGARAIRVVHSGEVELVVPIEVGGNQSL